MTTCKLMVREGKGAKDRTLWISDDLRDLIGEWLERRPASEWLFPTREGTQLDTRYLRATVKRYAEKAGIPEWEKVSPHTLRHTFATDLYRETKNIRLAQKALTHSEAQDQHGASVQAVQDHPSERARDIQSPGGGRGTETG